eukprot:gb/GECG01010264.1/.p1 GENE.gb/GECG01010264.1/~~gb/GECG01010264.1/.p1  ORF type:complete len:348 (+),score=33.00 gb/GECG01010264.1/:1-1044(+)
MTTKEKNKIKPPAPLRQVLVKQSKSDYTARNFTKNPSRDHVPGQLQRSTLLERLRPGTGLTGKSKVHSLHRKSVATTHQRNSYSFPSREGSSSGSMRTQGSKHCNGTKTIPPTPVKDPKQQVSSRQRSHTGEETSQRTHNKKDTTTKLPPVEESGFRGGIVRRDYRYLNGNKLVSSSLGSTAGDNHSNHKRNSSCVDSQTAQSAWNGSKSDSFSSRRGYGLCYSTESTTATKPNSFSAVERNWQYTHSCSSSEKTAACYKENQQDKTSRLQPRDHPRSFRLRTDTGSNPGTVDTDSTDSSQEFLSKLGENAQASCTVDGLPLLLKLQNYDPGEPQSPLKSRKGYFRF